MHATVWLPKPSAAASDAEAGLGGQHIAPLSGANNTGSSSSPSASAGFQSGTMGAL